VAPREFYMISLKAESFRNYRPYFYLLPSMILIIIIYVYPLVQNVIKSLYRFSGGREIFVGFGNYKYLILKDSITRGAFLHNIQILLVIPILLVLAILFAVLLSEKIRFAKVYQAILFVPFITSIVVVGVVFSRLLRWDGIINFLLNKIGLGALRRDWLGDPKYALYSLMAVIIWRELAFGIVLFIAGIGNINQELYEAAKIDGASWWQQLFHITIPQLKSVISFYVIYNYMIVFAWIFTYVYVMTAGGPVNSTTILELQIFNFAFKKNMMGMASSLAILLFLMIFGFIYLQFRLRRTTMEESY
jgi:ABC-type sugar transport system permease subunit